MRLHVSELPYRPPEHAIQSWIDCPHLAWLDSAGRDARGRYSYVCPRPFRVLRAWQRRVHLDDQVFEADPFAILQRELSRWRLTPQGDASPVPFFGGAVGLLGYGAGRLLEALPNRHSDPLAMPDLCVGFYDQILAFDHVGNRCWAIVTIRPEQDGGLAWARDAARCLAQDLQISARYTPFTPLRARWQHDADRAAYCGKVGLVQNYIRQGDIFQANLTTRSTMDVDGVVERLPLYRRLRELTPAPFGAYLGCGPSLAILSASPERFIHLDCERRIETRPIKGTRPRSAEPAQDAADATALAGSDKDRAENLMIVDLLRNDLGRVAEQGSVRVPVLFGIESFSSLHHMVSVVTATLRGDCDAVDLLRAAFPGGSVTGAPKIRAMQIIDALETCARGPYCGAIFWIGFDGAMDSSIVIRSLIATRTRLMAHAGGAVTILSDPQEEYDEMCAKRDPLLRAALSEEAVP